MKKIVLLLSILSAAPLLANAAAPQHSLAPGAEHHIGDRDRHGSYWDGFEWRSATWWNAHHGRSAGLKGPHGYWNGNGWQAQRPENHRTVAKRAQASHAGPKGQPERDTVAPRDRHE